MRSRSTLSFVLATFILSASAGAQATWHVDAAGVSPGTGSMADPYTSVGYALAQATTVSGDTVLVAPGTYADEEVDFLGKDVAVIGTGGALQTILVAPASAALPESVVTFDSGEGRRAVLDGFTVTGADLAGQAHGGGIHVEDASPTIVRCILEGNTTLTGGGMKAIRSSVVVRECMVRGNAPGFGGGLFFLECTGARVEDCEVRDNQAAFLGGGLYFEFSSVTVVDTLVENNAAANRDGFFSFESDLVFERVTVRTTDPLLQGGGGRLSSGSLTATDCIFVGNQSAAEDGAGLSAFEATLSLTRCQFEDNRALNGFMGGAIDIQTGQLDLIDTRFVGNSAGDGGAINSAVPLAIAGCTFLGNVAQSTGTSGVGNGGALRASQGTARRSVFARNEALGGIGAPDAGVGGAVFGPLTLERCTLFANSAAHEGAGALGANLVDSIAWSNSPDQLASATARFSDVQGGFAGVGNFDADPEFVDPGRDDFHLRPGSPCIDAGDPASPTDLDGTRADTGAFDFRDCNENGVPDDADIAAGTSTDFNLNDFPDECECRVTRFCQAAPHSEGPGARMLLVGPPSLLLGVTSLRVEDAPANRSGIFFYGSSSVELPFGDGLRCVGGSVFRYAPMMTDSSGAAERPLDYASPPQPAGQIEAGSRFSFQFWFRDPSGPGGSGFNTSDAVEVLFCP